MKSSTSAEKNSVFNDPQVPVANAALSDIINNIMLGNLSCEHELIRRMHALDELSILLSKADELKNKKSRNSTSENFILGCAAYSKKEYATAKECFEKNLPFSHASSQYFLGKIHLMREGMADDDQVGFAYLLQSAELGNPYAKMELDIIYPNQKSQIPAGLSGFNARPGNVFTRMWQGVKSLWNKLTKCFLSCFGGTDSDASEVNTQPIVIGFGSSSFVDPGHEIVIKDISLPSSSAKTMQSLQEGVTSPAYNEISEHPHVEYGQGVNVYGWPTITSACQFHHTPFANQHSMFYYDQEIIQRQQQEKELFLATAALSTLGFF